MGVAVHGSSCQALAREVRGRQVGVKAVPRAKPNTFDRISSRDGSGVPARSRTTCQRPDAGRARRQIRYVAGDDVGVRTRSEVAHAQGRRADPRGRGVRPQPAPAHRLGRARSARSRALLGAEHPLERRDARLLRDPGVPRPDRRRADARVGHARPRAAQGCLRAVAPRWLDRGDDPLDRWPPPGRRVGGARPTGRGPRGVEVADCDRAGTNPPGYRADPGPGGRVVHG